MGYALPCAALEAMPEVLALASWRQDAAAAIYSWREARASPKSPNFALLLLLVQFLQSQAGLLQTRPLRPLHVLGLGLREKLGVTNPGLENPVLIAFSQSFVLHDIHGRRKIGRRVQDGRIHI